MKTVLRVCMLLSVLIVGPVLAEGFKFTDTQGKVHRLQDYRGKWLLVNFWATWCPPCQQETPELIALYEAHRKTDLAVIGMALDSTRPAVAEFVAKYKISYPIVVGSYTMAEQVGAVEVLPTSYLFDPTGKLVSFQEGMVSRKDIELYLELKAKQKKKQP